MRLLPARATLTRTYPFQTPEKSLGLRLVDIVQGLKKIFGDRVEKERRKLPG